MWGRVGPSTWFPDRPPKRSEIVSVACALVLLLLYLPLVPSPSWKGVSIGFVAVGLVLGPVANSPAGSNVGRWFRAIGVGGRATVFVVFCCGLVLLLVFAPVPIEFLYNAGIGGLLGIVTYIVAYLGWAKATGVGD